MRIQTDNGYVGANANPSYGGVTVVVSDDEGCAVLILDVDQCNEVLAALIEARNAVQHALDRANE